MNIVKEEATAEVFLTAFKSLSKKEKDIFLTKLAEDKELFEDLMDIAAIEYRRNEPSRSFDEFLKEENSGLPN